MKRIKLGKKESSCCEVAKPTPKGRMFYPSIYISDRKLPIDKETVGDTMKATVSLKLTSLSESKNDDGKDSYTYHFDIHDISFGD